MPLTVDLQNQGQAYYSMTFFILCCIHDIDYYLQVDFTVFDATDLSLITISHFNSKDDLENQGQSYLLVVTSCSL